MKLANLLNETKGIPFIGEPMKKELYGFILEHKPDRVLELGFAHGVSACTMAAAMDENGHGSIDTVDLRKSKTWQEKVVGIEQLSERLGVSRYINVHRETTCYTWWLKKAIEQKASDPNWKPYDFIFLDGSHSWNIDTAAFFLCEKILAPGGWILFDDLKYNYEQYFQRTGNKHRFGVARDDLADDELTQSHVGMIYEMLVKPHESFDQFQYTHDENWGWARKSLKAA